MREWKWIPPVQTWPILIVCLTRRWRTVSKIKISGDRVSSFFFGERAQWIQNLYFRWNYSARNSKSLYGVFPLCSLVFDCLFTPFEATIKISHPCNRPINQFVWSRKFNLMNHARNISSSRDLVLYRADESETLFDVVMF